MTTLTKTIVAAVAFAAIATSAFSQAAWEFKSGMAYMYAGPGKMSAMAMAAGDKGHGAMMKHATSFVAAPHIQHFRPACFQPVSSTFLTSAS